MVRRIRPEELNDLAREWHFQIDDAELGEYETLIETVATILDGLDDPDGPPDDLVAERNPGRAANRTDDPYNAVVRWCSVKSQVGEGALSHTKVGLKDSIAVSGVPMTAGSTVLGGFVPSRDSVITERLLGAGAEIVAITNMDCFAFSGGGDSSVYGPTLCPFDLTRTAGGSSGGSAAALYYEDVDATIGCDQGGSIRIPASWCGVLGLKPTYGLVPYVGVAGIDQTFDHAGPMARTAAEAASVLQVIAGRHQGDPRQEGSIPTQDYVAAVAEAPDDLRGTRIGVVTEAFGPEVGTEPEVSEAIHQVVERMRQLHADVRWVSFPDHLQAGSIAFAGFVEGMTALVASGGNGHGWKGDYWPELAIALNKGLAAFGNELSPQMKLTLMFGRHLQRHYSGAYYAKAQNLRPALRAAHDRALSEFDVLLMPTSPGRAHRHVPDLPISEHVIRGWAVLANTTPTDMTGHPAITLPAAESGGLPVGVMLVGHHFGDARLLAIARTYERAVGWVPNHPGDPRTGNR